MQGVIHRGLWSVCGVAVLAMLAAGGCSSDSQPASNGTGAADAENSAADAAGAQGDMPSTKTGGARSGGNASADDKSPAVFAGRVVFHGELPPPRKITVNKDVEHCKAAGGEVQEVVVGDDGGLADVVVEIMGIEAGDQPWSFQEPEGGYAVHQKGCSFSPRLVVMPDGADLHVYNDDPVSHNVNTGQWNVVQPTGGDPIIKPIKARSPVRVVCNIHSWMEAWVYPVRSPFYARTGKDGKFRIENVPPGDYRVSVWHPSLGRKRLREKFAGGATLEKEIAFEAP